jgi:trehalose 6-phosphate phosphatase
MHITTRSAQIDSFFSLSEAPPAGYRLDQTVLAPGLHRSKPQAHALPSLPLPSWPSWSSPQGTALFLDFDGTLADLAPQPDSVQIAPELIALLAQLADRLHGALALVSGRPLKDLDHYLAPLVLPAAAEHGALRRLVDGSLQAVAAPDLSHVAAAAHGLAAQHAGLRVEVKSAAVALHYRHAPALEGVCRDVLSLALERSRGVELLHGKFVFEIKPAGVNKGTAIAAFMREAPFSGRLPVFAGDDTTDESGFAVVQSLGGMGVKVGEGPTQASHRLDSPATLRSWLLAAQQSESSFLPLPLPASQRTPA